MSPPWTVEQSASLLGLAPRVRTSRVEWSVIAKQFPGRSMSACRQQFYKLRMLPAGELPGRKKSVRGPRRRRLAVLSVRSPAQNTSAFAEHFGDPPPGRSALDKLPPAKMPTLRSDLPRRTPIDETRTGLA